VVFEDYESPSNSGAILMDPAWEILQNALLQDHYIV